MYFSSYKNDGVDLKVWREREMENTKKEVKGLYLPPKSMLTVFFSPFRKHYESTILSFVEMMAVVQQVMFLIFSQCLAMLPSRIAILCYTGSFLSSLSLSLSHTCCSSSIRIPKL